MYFKIHAFANCRILITLGSSPFLVNPSWNLDGKLLREQKTVTYLVTSLSETTNDHGRRAFYDPQSAGLYTNGVTPDAAAHMIKVAIQLVLVYGCVTININPGAIKRWRKRKDGWSTKILQKHASTQSSRN